MTTPEVAAKSSNTENSGKASKGTSISINGTDIDATKVDLQISDIASGTEVVVGIPIVQNIDRIETISNELSKNHETGDSEDVVADVKLKLEDAANLISKGARELALNHFEDAAESLAMAVEIQVEHLGQYAPETAPTFYLYGKALLLAAIEKNTVLGEGTEKNTFTPAAGESSANNNSTKQTSEVIISETNDKGARFVFEGDDVEDIEEDEEEEIDVALDELEPINDDLELAWENLDVARIILSKLDDVQSRALLADVYLSIGDVSLESENFDQAVNDYEHALQLKIQIDGSCRELAEVHFKLGLAFEYSEQNEDAITQIQMAMDSLKKRMLQCGVGEVDASIVLPKDSKGIATSIVDKVVLNDKSGINNEVLELQGFLEEMEMKLQDLTTLIEKEDLGEQISTVTPLVVNDISNLVKKRKVEGDDFSKKQAKVDLAGPTKEV